MSNELVMAAIPSECFPWELLVERQPDGTLKTLGDIYYPKGRKNATTFVTAEQAMSEHPNAFWRTEIHPANLWQPPAEPWGKHGALWCRDRRLVREYREVLRRSLQEFLNRHLADLNFMFRTGAFVVGVVRAKVVELRPVPKYAMRQFGRAFKKPGRWKTLRKPTRMKNGT